MTSGTRSGLSAKLERVAEVSRLAGAAPRFDRLFGVVAAAAREVFSCRSVGLILLAEDSGLLSIKAASGLVEQTTRDFRRPVGTGVVAEVMLKGRDLLCDRVSPGSAEAVELRLDHDPVSVMCVRLAVDSRSIGCLLCESEKESAFTPDDLQLLKLMAEVTSLAIGRETLRAVSRKLVMTDPLTQAYSYAYFHRRLTEEVERALRLNQFMSVLLVEVDDIGKYRQANGWQAAEQLLNELVKLVSAAVRNIDVVGRYGVGDVILYLPETPRDKAALAAERIRSLVEKGAKASRTEGPVGKPLGVTVSIGLASLPENGDTVNRLLDGVTCALLTAERSGGNCVAAAEADVTARPAADR